MVMCLDKLGKRTPSVASQDGELRLRITDGHGYTSRSNDTMELNEVGQTT
jgi:hypothetical protein